MYDSYVQVTTVYIHTLTFLATAADPVRVGLCTPLISLADEVEDTTDAAAALLLRDRGVWASSEGEEDLDIGEVAVLVIIKAAALLLRDIGLGEGLLVLCGEELFCEGCFLEEVPVLFGCLGQASSSCVGEGEEERLGELVMASAGPASLSEQEK